MALLSLECDDLESPGSLLKFLKKLSSPKLLKHFLLYLTICHRVLSSKLVKKYICFFFILKGFFICLVCISFFEHKFLWNKNYFPFHLQEESFVSKIYLIFILLLFYYSWNFFSNMKIVTLRQNWTKMLIRMYFRI